MTHVDFDMPLLGETGTFGKAGTIASCIIYIINHTDNKMRAVRRMVALSRRVERSSFACSGWR
jgi:hypothetical protein